MKSLRIILAIALTALPVSAQQFSGSIWSPSPTASILGNSTITMTNATCNTLTPAGACTLTGTAAVAGAYPWMVTQNFVGTLSAPQSVVEASAPGSWFMVYNSTGQSLTVGNGGTTVVAPSQAAPTMISTVDGVNYYQGSGTGAFLPLSGGTLTGSLSALQYTATDPGNPGGGYIAAGTSTYGTGYKACVYGASTCYFMEAYSDVDSCPTPYCGMFGVGGLSGTAAGSEVFDFANHSIYKPYLIAASGGAVGDCEYISSGSGLEGLKPCGGGGGTSNLIVGSGAGQYATISLAIAAANSLAGPATIEIASTATPSDTPTNATGCTVPVILIDDRANPVQSYKCQQGYFYAQQGDWQQYAFQRIADVQSWNGGGDYKQFSAAVATGTARALVTGDSIHECADQNYIDCPASIFFQALQAKNLSLSLVDANMSISGSGIENLVDPNYLSQPIGTGSWAASFAYTVGQVFTYGTSPYVGAYLVQTAYASGSSFGSSDLSNTTKISTSSGGYARYAYQVTPAAIWPKGSVWLQASSLTRASNVSTLTVSSTSNLPSIFWGTVVGGTDATFSNHTAAASAWSCASNVWTITATNAFTGGAVQTALLTGFTAGSAINGQYLLVQTASGSDLTVNFPCGAVTSATEVGYVNQEVPFTVASSTTITYPNQGSNATATGTYAVAQSWLDAARSQTPDVYLEAHGQNDVALDPGVYANDLATFYAATRQWTPAPTLVLSTNYLPTKYYAPYSGYQVGLAAKAAETRGFARENNIITADAGRIQAILRDGVDYVQTQHGNEPNFFNYPAAWVTNGSVTVTPGSSSSAGTLSVAAGNVASIARNLATYDGDFSAEVTVGTGATDDVTWSNQDTSSGPNGYELRYEYGSGSAFLQLYYRSTLLTSTTVTTGGPVFYLDFQRTVFGHNLISVNGSKVIDNWDFQEMTPGYFTVGVAGSGSTASLWYGTSLTPGYTSTFAGALVPEGNFFGTGISGPGSGPNCTTLTMSACGDTIHHTSSNGAAMIFAPVYAAAATALAKPALGGGFPVTIGNTPITAGSTNSSLDGLTLNPTTAAPARVTTLGISGVVTQAVSSTGDTANVYENTGGGALFFVAKSSNGYAGFEVQNSATGQGWQSGLLGGADEYSITNSVSGNRVLTIQPASPAGSIAVNADGSTTFGGTTTAPTVNATSAYQANGTPGITASCTVGVGTVITISQGIITACGTP
jgi:hypothetical protein